MGKTLVVGRDEIKAQRLAVPHNLSRKQYVELRMNYMKLIVSSKTELKKSFDKYKEFLAEVLSARRKLNDAEDRLVEVFERLEKVK